MSSNLTNYLLHLADNALVLGHRNSEWTGYGPILEQDIALSNIALDLIGQARHFYQYAAKRIGGTATEDSLAYLRGAGSYLNALLVEQDNGDWAKTILRQFLFSAYQYPLYQQLEQNADTHLAGIAEKSLKEVTYHLRWSSEWVIRLGRGTQESSTRMANAVSQLWMFTEELYTPASYETEADDQQQPVNSAEIRSEWLRRTHEIMEKAGLDIPVGTLMITGGKEGIHTVHLQQMLEDMQYMQREYPGVEW